MRRINNNHFLYIHAFALRVACVLLILFAVALGIAQQVAAASDESSDGEFVVTIYDQGKKRVVLTTQNTVAKTLEQAGASLSEYDRVEPALDTEFVARSYTVNIYRARPVMIVDGMKREQVLTPYGAAKDIVQDAGIPVRDEDILTLNQTSDMLSDGVGSRLTIERATEVALVLYGSKSAAYTQAETVDEFLDDKNIKLAEGDTLSIDAAQPIVEGMTIEVWRNGVQTVTEEQEIAFPVEQIQDADREVGYREVKTPGVKGKKAVTYEVTMKNGQEVARKEIQSVETTKPEKQVEIVGAKPSFSGDFAAALAKLRSCEGNYNSWNPAGPYYGAYQFNEGTWKSVSSAPYGSATPAEQDAAARALYERRGWQPWPHCGANLPDTYR